MTTRTPRETDTELAAVWHEIQQAREQLARAEASLKSYAGASWYYRGRQRVTDMLASEALAYCTKLAADHSEASDYARFDLTPPIHGGANLGNVRGSLQRHEAATLKLIDLAAQAEALEATYTGWSRFFLVTSSSGHVHSSTHCQTCRPTTTYGWLPQLSGKDEATAVAELGPTLCSVCFASAPTEWTAGKKITAAQAARKAA
jgi:hypothetical protein